MSGAAPAPFPGLQPYRSLYVHVPFCGGGKCDYCAFYSLGHPTVAQKAAYLSCLEREFQAHAGECAPLESIFLGGGTPSSLSAGELEILLAQVRRHFALLPDCEWSCEANPDSLDEEKLSVLLAGGVNRLSLGIQSFQPSVRASLGRRGSLEGLEGLLRAARQGGLRRLNLDLIDGAPGEGVDQWRQDLESALRLSPDHMSCYSLILEEGTPLAHRVRPPSSPREAEEQEERFLECWRECDRLLGAAGLRRYEISNFAREGCHCRHNDQVWHGQTYLGCGPAAVSFNGLWRSANPQDLEDWLQGRAPERDLLPPEARRREILAFGMRTTAGWEEGLLRLRTGLELQRVVHLPECRRLLQEGLLEFTGGWLAPTPRGLLLNDTILEALIL